MNSTLTVIPAIPLQNETSVTLLQSQTGVFISWIIFASINMVAAVMTILTIATWKPLHTDTQFFMVNLAFCEIGISLSSIGPAIYHLYNIYFKIPEVMLQSACFGELVFWQFMFMLLVPVYHTVLSFDRFMSAVFPLFYRNRSRYYSRIIATFVWIVSPSITAILFGSVSGSLMIVQCLGRYATNVGSYYSYTQIAISSLSLFISILLMVILQIQIWNRSNNNGNVAEIGRRIRNQVTQCVALIAVFNFLSYTFSLVFVSIFDKVISDFTVVGLYLNVFYYFGGVFSFIVYFYFQKDFRAGFYSLVRKIPMKPNNSVKVLPHQQRNM